MLRMPDPVPEPGTGRPAAGEDTEAAAGRITAAATAVRERLERLAQGASGTSREVLETTAMMAADPTLVSTAQGLVRSGDLSAERAVWEAAGQVIDQLTAIGGYMGERARDVADVRDRVVAELTGRPGAGRPGPGPPVRARRAGPRPGRHRDARPRARRRDRHERGRADVAHRDPGPRARHPRARRGAHGADDLADGTRVLVDGANGHA